MGWAADADSALGTEAVAELESLCREVHLRFPRAVFFAGKLIFRHESWWQRVLHNETAHAVQRRLEFDGLTMVVLPISHAEVTTRGVRSWNRIVPCTS